MIYRIYNSIIVSCMSIISREEHCYRYINQIVSSQRVFAEVYIGIVIIMYVNS